MNRGYYAILPAHIRYDENITPNAKLLYAEITALANDRGYCWATNTYFADLYGVTTVSISKWIKNLIDYGYITSEIKYKSGTKQIEKRQIRIVEDPKEVLNKNLIPIKEKLLPPQTNVNGVLNKSLKPIKEKFKENNKKEYYNMNIKNEYIGIDEKLVNVIQTAPAEIQQQLKEYVEYRDLLGRPFNATALRYCINELLNLSDRNNDKAIKILKQSIMNGWYKLVPLKEDSPAKAGSKKETIQNDMNYQNYSEQDIERIMNDDF